MNELEEAEAKLAEYKIILDDAWDCAMHQDSPGGNQITSEERETINFLSERVDRLRVTIKELQEESEGNTPEDNPDNKPDGSNPNSAISYSDFKYRTWKWKLVDKDWLYDDFGAGLEFNFRFGKVDCNSSCYWILDGVTPSPQSTTGLKLEVSSLTTTYYEIGGKLEMRIEFQFKLSTADIDVSTSTGIGLSLSADVKKEIGASLAAPTGGGPSTTVSTGGGVNAGFTASHEWTSSQVLPGSAATVTRGFVCTNDGNGKLNILLKYKNDVNASAIDDPGMDTVGGADWEITSNDNSFSGTL